MQVYREVHGWLSACQVPRSCGCTIRPNHHPSTTVLDSWYELIVLILCLVVSQHGPVHVCSTAKHLHFALTCPKDIVAQVFANLSLPAIILSRKQAFSCTSFQTNHSCSVFFLNCTVLTIFLLLKLLTWPYNPSQTIGLLIPDVLPECCRPSN